MNKKYFYITFLMAFALISASCERELSDDAVPAPFNSSPTVFLDGFTPGLEYYPYADSKQDAFSVDTENKYLGTSAMRFDIPNVGDVGGAYAGAIFRDDFGGRDLSGYDALTFWAKASKSAVINEIGFGQDFEGNTYEVSRQNLAITTGWTKYVIPIPDPSKLKRQKGMFWYSEGPEGDEVIIDGQSFFTEAKGYTFWIDELQWEKLGTLAQPRPSILDGQDVAVETFNGSNVSVTNLFQTFNSNDGQDIKIATSASYFDFTTSNAAVASVDAAGNVQILSAGTAVITAELNGVQAAGSITIVSQGDYTPAPTPTVDASNVISLFSDAYTNAPVDYYNGYWAPFQRTIGQDDININGDNVINYKELNFVGIQFTQPTINASSMTHFHIDVQVQEAMQPGDFLTIRLVDIGGDNAFGGNDDSSGEIRLTNNNLISNGWVSVDVALSNLNGLNNKSNMAQIVFVSDGTIKDVLVDNIYFYEVPTAPTGPAPIPTTPAADVLSIFSDAYDNVAGTDFNPNWGQATVVTTEQISGDNVLKYANLNYQGTQFAGSIDASGMSHIHIDYYSATSTALNFFLISPGPTERAKSLTVPTTAGWNSIDIPLTDFSPVDLSNIIQFKVDGNGDIFFDNIYFHK